MTDAACHCRSCREDERGGRYVAQAFDRVGQLAERGPSPKLSGAIDGARALRAKYPDAVILVANIDEVDLGRSDGLTDEERDLVQEVL